MSRIDDITMREYIENHGMNEEAARVFLMQQKEIEELKRQQRARITHLKYNPLQSSPFMLTLTVWPMRS